ncbi:MAG TPA: CDP-diacylglycerol--glycerol-3-phosphate 3-phosphatidyltransferase [Pseudomonadales bacterium]|jgi:CDP-diacylglycerol--glycerol-3-phosphate 3-phosphatidyltransferase
MNIPNALTVFRVVLVPVCVVAFYLPTPWAGFIAGLIFAIASITDWFDGYLARKLNQSTPLGAFLDPVADKLMVAVALVLLVSVHDSAWFALMCSVIIGREIVVSALREWMAELGKRASIAVSYVGKVKTTTQMVAIGVLLGARTYPYFETLGFVLLLIAALLTLWSMIIYVKAAWPALMGHKDA